MNERDIYGVLKHNHDNFGFVPMVVMVHDVDCDVDTGVLRLASRLHTDYVVEVKVTKHSGSTHPAGTDLCL